MLQTDFFKNPVAVFDYLLFFRHCCRIPEDGAGNPGVNATMAADHDVFQDRHILKQTDILKRTGHAAFGDMVGFDAVDPLRFFAGRRNHDVAFSRVVDAGDAIEKGGFTGTVGSDQGNDFALFDIEVKMIQGPQAAEIHRQRINFK